MQRAAGFGVSIIVAAGLILSEAQVWAQCAMCRAALGAPDGQRLAAALRSGIVILLIAPVAAFGLIAFAAIRSRRRDRAGTEAFARPEPCALGVNAGAMEAHMFPAATRETATLRTAGRRDEAHGSTTLAGQSQTTTAV